VQWRRSAPSGESHSHPAARPLGDREGTATRRTGTAFAIGLLAAVALAGPANAATPSNTTFADVIAGSKLVIYAHIVERPDGGFTFDVIRLLKGATPTELVYPPINTAAPMAGWTRAVVAFADPRNDDFRAPTIAWHVASNGAIDPEHDQRYPGLPLTLNAMLAYFGAPATSTDPPAEALSPSYDVPLLAIVFVGASLVVFRSSRFRSKRHAE